MEKNKTDCCNSKSRKGKGFLSGLLYGLIPHAGCILFIVFTVLGVTAATAVFRQFLLNFYAFYILIGASFVLATLSAALYLNQRGDLSFWGIRRKWKYLSVLYGTTIFINILMFLVIFPMATNAIGPKENLPAGSEPSFVTLQVSIPCSGHALLISGELQTIAGVTGVKFRSPNYFDVSYDAARTSPAQILLLEVFKTYSAKVVGQGFGV